jgi:hypothetical protein
VPCADLNCYLVTLSCCFVVALLHCLVVLLHCVASLLRRHVSLLRCIAPLPCCLPAITPQVPSPPRPPLTFLVSLPCCFTTLCWLVFPSFLFFSREELGA